MAIFNQKLHFLKIKWIISDAAREDWKASQDTLSPPPGYQHSYSSKENGTQLLKYFSSILESSIFKIRVYISHVCVIYKYYKLR